MRSVYVLRKPCAESSVSANSVRFGVGGLNIDGTRVGAEGGLYDAPKACKAPGWDSYNRSNAEAGYRPSDYRQGDALYTPHRSGRWPANVVFHHLAGCHCSGVGKVPGHKGYPHGPGGKSMHYSDQESRGEQVRPQAWRGHADADGMETVTVWECAPGCPVAALDLQSGVSKSSGGRVGNAQGVYANQGPTGWGTGHMSGDPGFGDTGGASRYFKQFRR